MERVFVDTNYFLRLILADNNPQSEQVEALFNQAARGELVLATTSLVFFELYRVLSTSYRQPKAVIIQTLRRLLTLPYLEVEGAQTLAVGLDLYATHRLDLEDCYYLAWARQSGISQIASFDQDLQRAWRGMGKALAGPARV